MAVTPYATLDDLGSYLGVEPPVGASKLLQNAQDLIDAILTSATYGIDTAGENATDATVILALKKATVRQVEDWINKGTDTTDMDNWSSYTIAGVSVSRAVYLRKQYRLCDRAWDALRAGKLTPGNIFVT